MSMFNFLNISAVHRETPSAVSVSFEVPSNLQSLYTFKAGQYITLKTSIDGTEIRRDYSLSSTPNSGDLTITIKAIEGGLFSTYANTKLNIGDQLEVGTPKGRFVFEDSSTSKSVVAFAAGSGITPIMSITKTLLESNIKNRLTLVYGNKSPNDTIFLEALHQLEKHYSDQLKVHYVFSQSNEDKALFGRIDKGIVNHICKAVVPLSKVDAFYLCGPEGMISTVRETLEGKGVDSTQIHFELFTSSAIEPDQHIETANKDETAITVLVDDEESHFSMTQNMTVLEAALKQDIDVPYSCQGGVCSSCIGRITEGQARMHQNTVLTDSEVNEGLILSCQAVPTSAVLKVDFDDI